jgi:hypothetical protein
MSSDDRHRQVLAWAFARLDRPAFVLASAATAAIVVFALTAAILVKGAPPGDPVGPNLAHLAFYFPGYSVSAAGSLVGAAYGCAVGAASGFIVATLWNLAHELVLALIRVRANLDAYTID